MALWAIIAGNKNLHFTSAAENARRRAPGEAQQRRPHPTSKQSNLVRMNGNNIFVFLRRRPQILLMR